MVEAGGCGAWERWLPDLMDRGAGLVVEEDSSASGALVIEPARLPTDHGFFDDLTADPCDLVGLSWSFVNLE